MQVNKVTDETATTPPALPFIARRPELDVLGAAYDDAVAGSARVVLIAGETGVGKSRLVSEFVAGLGERDALVVSGSSPIIVGADIPFAPIAASLRDLSQRLPSERLGELVPSDSELARLLPGHASIRGGVVDPLAQVRLFEQWLSLLVRLGSEYHGGVVIVLEDIHWVDASTRDLLAYFVANLSTGRLLLVLTVRGEGLAGNSSLRSMLFEATRQPSVRPLDLDPLTVEETEALVSTLAGSNLTGEARARVAAISGGNPLFVEQLLRAGGDKGLPSTLVALVAERLERLTPAARRVAQLAAAAMPGLPLAVLDEAATMLQLDLAAALAELHNAGIVGIGHEAADETPQFRHPVVQEVMYAALMPNERKALHRALGEAMGRSVESRATDPAWVLELARNLWMAGDGEKALPALVAAGDTAMESFAFSEALTLYERAIDAAGRGGPTGRAPIGFRLGATPRTGHGDSASLAERAAQAASLAGRPERALELLEMATGPTPLRPRVSRRRAEYLWEAGRQAEALEVYTAALADLPEDSDERAALQGAAARATLLAGHADAAQQMASEAVEVARAAGAESDELHALYTLSAAQARVGAPDTALATLAQARDLDLRRQRRSRIQPRPSRIVDLLSGYWSEATVLGSAGRTEEAADAALEGAQTAAKLGIRGGWGGMVGVAAAEELIAIGRWAEAQALLDDWLAGAPSTESAHWHATYAYLMALQGHAAQASQHLATSQAAARARSDPHLRAAQLRAEAEIGFVTRQGSEASRSLELGLQDLGDVLERAEFVELVALSLRAAAEQADQAQARRATAELAALRSNAVVLHGRALARGDGSPSTSRPRLEAFLTWAGAELARVAGNRDPAPWLAASDRWAALREPYRAGYARFRAAAEQLAKSGLRQDARDSLAFAHATCLELGAEALRREVEALARRARIDLAPSSSGSRDPDPGADESTPVVAFGLSPRELEVLELVADGRTNRQIGEALFITEKTAGHHVSSILGKLGVASRVEAASIAARASIGVPGLPTVAVQAAAAMGGEGTVGNRSDATLMFTDIVRSTALLEAIGDDAWLELISWHDGLIRSLIKAYAGREVDHAGDGFFVVFSDVIAALDCSVAIQRALAEHRRKHGFAPRVRVAVHRAVVVSHGPALRGKGVHVAARIAEATRGDEILISSDSLASVGQRYLRGELRTVAGAGLSETISVVLIEWRSRPTASKSG